MWDLGPQPRIKLGTPAMGACLPRLSHWTTREILAVDFLMMTLLTSVIPHCSFCFNLAVPGLHGGMQDL